MGNSDVADPLGQLFEFPEEFAALDERGYIVFGIAPAGLKEGPTFTDYVQAIRRSGAGLSSRSLQLDAREHDHMRTCLLALIANMENRAAGIPGQGQAA